MWYERMHACSVVDMEVEGGLKRLCCGHRGVGGEDTETEGRAESM